LWHHSPRVRNVAWPSRAHVSKALRHRPSWRREVPSALQRTAAWRADHKLRTSLLLAWCRWYLGVTASSERGGAAADWVRDGSHVAFDAVVDGEGIEDTLASPRHACVYAAAQCERGRMVHGWCSRTNVVRMLAPACGKVCPLVTSASPSGPSSGGCGRACTARSAALSLCHPEELLLGLLLPLRSRCCQSHFRIGDLAHTPLQFQVQFQVSVPSSSLQA
jgi:hypothetical protein